MQNGRNEGLAQHSSDTIAIESNGAYRVEVGGESHCIDAIETVSNGAYGIEIDGDSHNVTIDTIATERNDARVVEVTEQNTSIIATESNGAYGVEMDEQTADPVAIATESNGAYGMDFGQRLRAYGNIPEDL